MITRRGFFTSVLLTSIAAKVFRTKVDPPTAGNDSPAPDTLRDVSIFDSLDAPSSLRCVAPAGTFKVGERITCNIGGRRQFDGIILSIAHKHSENVEHIEAVDWDAHAQRIGRKMMDDMVRDMRATRVLL